MNVSTDCLAFDNQQKAASDLNKTDRESFRFFSDG